MLSFFTYLVQSAVFTVLPVVRLVSMAYWSTAASIMRRSLRILEACERLRARRNPGTAIAASNAMIATTIMISTSVKPACFRFNLVNIILLLIALVYCLFVFELRWRGFFRLRFSQLIPCHSCPGGMAGE